MEGAPGLHYSEEGANAAMWQSLSGDAFRSQCLFKPAPSGEEQKRCGQQDAKVTLCSGEEGGFLKLAIKGQAGCLHSSETPGQETAGRCLGRQAGRLSAGCLGAQAQMPGHDPGRT